MRTFTSAALLGLTLAVELKFTPSLDGGFGNLDTNWQNAGNCTPSDEPNGDPWCCDPSEMVN